jgi:hypothetical protein
MQHILYICGITLYQNVCCSTLQDTKALSWPSYVETKFTASIFAIEDAHVRWTINCNILPTKSGF